MKEIVTDLKAEQQALDSFCLRSKMSSGSCQHQQKAGQLRTPFHTLLKSMKSLLHLSGEIILHWMKQLSSASVMPTLVLRGDEQCNLHES